MLLKSLRPEEFLFLFASADQLSWIVHIAVEWPSSKNINSNEQPKEHFFKAHISNTTDISRIMPKGRPNKKTSIWGLFFFFRWAIAIRFFVSLATEQTALSAHVQQALRNWSTFGGSVILPAVKTPIVIFTAIKTPTSSYFAWINMPAVKTPDIKY